jgi:hypothetical protein
MSKIFNNGGWLNSTNGAFNQPSTYVGIKHVQRNPDLPPLQGIQDFLKENERLRKEHEAYRKAASPDDAKFAEMMEKAKGTSGQVSELAQMYSQFKQEFHRKFQGDAVFSDEAKQALAQITSRFGPAAMNELEQNLKLYESQKERVSKEEVGDNIWTDGKQVLVEYADGKREIMSADLYGHAITDPKMSGKIRALTNSEALDWKDKNWRIGEADRHVIGNQMSMKSVIDFIDKQYNNLGHTSNGRQGDQFTDLTQYLQGIGINVANGNVIQQVTQKFKDNSAQLAQVTQRIYETLPPEAKSAIMSQMFSRGENPYGKTEVKDKDGKKVEVSNLAIKMQEIIGSSSGAKFVTESEQGTSLKSSSSVLGSGSDGGAVDLMQMIYDAPSIFPGARGTKFWNPETGQVMKEVPTVPINHDAMKEKIPGYNKTEYVTDDRVYFLNGKYVSVGRGNNKNDPREITILPGADDITFVDQIKRKPNGEPVLDQNNQPITERIGMVRKQAVVNGATLESLNKEFDKPLFEMGTLWGAKGINGAEAQLEDVSRTTIIERYGLNETDAKIVGSMSGDFYLLTLWQPVHELHLRGDDKNKNDRDILYPQAAGWDGILKSRDNKGNTTVTSVINEMD